MNIIDALKEDEYALRITYNYRWMYYDSADDCWCVYEHKPYAKETKLIINTQNEEMAVQFLLEE